MADLAAAQKKLDDARARAVEATRHHGLMVDEALREYEEAKREDEFDRWGDRPRSAAPYAIATERDNPSGRWNVRFVKHFDSTRFATGRDHKETIGWYFPNEEGAYRAAWAWTMFGVLPKGVSFYGW